MPKLKINTRIIQLLNIERKRLEANLATLTTNLMVQPNVVEGGRSRK